MGKSVSRNSAFSMINKGLSVVFPLVTVSYISRDGARTSSSLRTSFRSGRNWRSFLSTKLGDLF